MTTAWPMAEKIKNRINGKRAKRCLHGPGTPLGPATRGSPAGDLGVAPPGRAPVRPLAQRRGSTHESAAHRPAARPVCPHLVRAEQARERYGQGRRAKGWLLVKGRIGVIARSASWRPVEISGIAVASPYHEKRPKRIFSKFNIYRAFSRARRIIRRSGRRLSIEYLEERLAPATQPWSGVPATRLGFGEGTRKKRF